MKRTISILLLIVTLLSAFSITAFADDNATGGDGDTKDAVDGYAWYNSYQYLWKVTVFVGKSDQASKQDNLTEDFYRIGTVIMKKTGWSVPAGTKFGSGTKVDYYGGVAMTMDTSPYIISDSKCPSIPVVCSSGDIETVKSYFGSTGTMTTVLNGIADDKGTTKEALLSQLTLTIGGRTKSGWDYEYIDPNAETNRVPWVIVYEPMMLLNLKDQVTKLAFTATEFALCEINGWYDFNKSGGSGQNCASLVEKHLPTSVQLEESWFGYPVYAVTDDSTKWKHEDIVKGGGWGMRWLSAAVKEPQKQDVDFGCSFATVDTSPDVGTYGRVVVNWTNYEEQAGTVLCCLYRRDELVWSEWKTIEAGATIQSSFTLSYLASDTQKLTCTINWDHRQEETDPTDNGDEVYVTPVEVAPVVKADYGAYFQEVEQPDQDTYGQVNVWWKNWTSEPGTVLCELYMDNELIWSEYKTFGANENIYSSLQVYYSGTNNHVLEVRINYANRNDEEDPTDNIAGKLITPNKIIDDTYDFSVSDLSVTPCDVYQGDTCTVTFVSDNWNHDVTYENILVEVLVNGEVVQSQYMNYSAFGRYQHSYTIDMEDFGTSTVTARINWANRNAEDNRTNNSASTTAEVKKKYEFSVSGLTVEPSSCYAGDDVTVSFRTDSWDHYNAYTDIPVEVLYNGQVIHTEYVSYVAFGGKQHSLTLNVGASEGVNEISVRVNWANRNGEENQNNNSASTTIEVKRKYEFSVSGLTIDPNSCYEGDEVTISFRTDSWDRYNAYTDIPVEVLYNGQVIHTEYVSYVAFGGKQHSLTLNVGASEGVNEVSARVNWENRNAEENQNNNNVSTTVEVKRKYEFSVSSLTVEPSSCYAGDDVTVSFRTDSWDHYNAYTDIPVEILYNGQVIHTEYVSYVAFGGKQHSLTLNVGASEGSNEITARVNWANRNGEENQTNNSASTTIEVKRKYEFSVSGLTVEPTSCYEGDDVTISFRTDSWDHYNAYTDIPVEILYNGQVIHTEYVSYVVFGGKQHSLTLNVGASEGVNEITARVNWANRNGEENQNNNSASTTIEVKRKYEFSVSGLTVEPTSCYEGDDVTISFHTDSWDHYNAYTDIPVEILYNGQVIHTEYVSYVAFGGKQHSLTLNVGASVGVNEITARINWADRTSEVSPTNNSTETISLVVQEKWDMAIEAVDPNSDYREGVTVITSYIIHNYGRYDIVPDHESAVTFEAYYFNGNEKVTISSQVWEQAVVPANDQNIVYFKWTVPSNLADTQIYCTATVNAELTTDEYSTANNEDTLTCTVAKKLSSQTPDTQYEAQKPSGFTEPSTPDVSAGKATWSMWIYEDGTFVKKNYGLAISALNPEIEPDSDSPSAEYVDGSWQMRSGYGFTISFSPTLVRLPEYEAPASNAYTGIQSVYATFPEFSYSLSDECFRTLQKVSGKWVFVSNANADNNKRLHFTPLWYPNGNYVVSATATEVWTPAGMISATRNSNAIIIVDSAYDDWYVGEQ